MARLLTAKIRLEADTKQANRNLQKTEVQLGKVGTASKALSGALGGLKAAFASAAIAGAALLFGLGKLIGLANEEEDAIQKLNAAIGNLTGEREALSQALQKNADALSAVTTLGNEEILAVQAQIAIFIKDEEQIRSLTKASLDFAAAQGTSAVGAAQLLTRTVVSSTNALVRQGLVVEGAAGSTERFASAMEALAVFEGQAASQADTASGKIGLLTDSFTDFLQEVTLILTGLNTFGEVLEGLTGIFNRAGSGIKFLRNQVGDLSGALAVVAESILPNFAAQLLGVEGATLKAVQAQEKQRAALGKQKAALDESTAATDALEEATKKSNDALLETEEAVDKTIAALRKLGVVLDEDVNRKLEEQTALLDATHDAFQRGAISRDDFERSELAINAEVAKLNGLLVEQVDVFGNSTDATEQYSAALRIATGGLDELTLAEIRNADTTVTSAERRAQARLNERNLGTQTIFGQRTTAGGTFFIPDEVSGESNGRVTIVRPGSGGAVL